MPNDLSSTALSNTFLTTTDHNPVARRVAGNGTAAATTLTWTISGLALAACQQTPFLVISPGGSNTAGGNTRSEDSQASPTLNPGYTTTSHSFSIADAATAASTDIGSLTVHVAAAAGGTTPVTDNDNPAFSDGTALAHPTAGRQTESLTVPGTYGEFTIVRGELGEMTAIYTVTASAQQRTDLGSGEAFYERLVVYARSGSDTPSIELEFDVGIAGNGAPTVTATGMATVDENVDDVELTGITITASDPDPSDVPDLTLTVISGETGQGALTDEEADQLFEVIGSARDGYTLKLRDGQPLDYEAKTSYELKIRVTDRSRIEVESSGTITVNVRDVDENTDDAAIAISNTAPEVGDQLSVTITADDPEGNGGTGRAFAPNTVYKWYHVSDDTTSIGSSQTYTVKASDVGERIRVEVIYTDGNQNVTTIQAQQTAEVSSSPMIAVDATDNRGTIAENDEAGDVAGLKFTASDADGDTLAFALESRTSGLSNTMINQLFEVVAVAGEDDTYMLKLKTGEEFDYEALPHAANIILVIKVTDGTFTIADGNGNVTADGGANVASTASVTVEVTDVDDTDHGDARLGILSTGDILRPLEGDVLRLNKLNADPDGNGGLDTSPSYHWFYTDAPASAIAMTATYTIRYADLGKMIGLRVDYTDAEGYAEMVTSEVETGAVTSGIAGDALWVRRDNMNLSSGQYSVDEDYTNAGVPIPDHTPMETGDKVGDLRDNAGSTSFTITGGEDRDKFVIVSRLGVHELYIKTASDYEAAGGQTLDLEIRGEGGSAPKDYTYVINVNNVDDNDASVTIARTSGGPGLHAVNDVYTAMVSPDADNGGAATTYTYTWSVDGTADMSRSGEGDTYRTFTLKAGDLGKMLKVDVRYADLGEGTDPATNSDTVSSPVITLLATAVVGNEKPVMTAFVTASTTITDGTASFHPLNTGPDASRDENEPAKVASGGSLTGQFAATDADNDAVAFSAERIVSGGANVAASVDAQTIGGKSYTHSIAATAGSVTFGTLHYNINSGEYIFEFDQEEVTKLQAGTDHTFDFAVSATDVNSAISDPLTLTFVIEGENDAPVAWENNSDVDDRVAGAVIAGTSTAMTYTGFSLWYTDNDDNDASLPIKAFTYTGDTVPLFTDRIGVNPAIIDTDDFQLALDRLQGKYGRFTFSSDNTTVNVPTTYTVGLGVTSTPDFNAPKNLLRGQTLQEKVVFYVSDGKGGVSAPVVLVVTITSTGPTTNFEDGSSDRTITISENRTTDTDEIVFNIGDESTATGDLRVLAATTSSTTGVPVTKSFGSIASSLRIEPGETRDYVSTYGKFIVTRDAVSGRMTAKYDLNETLEAVEKLNMGQYLYDKLSLYSSDGPSVGTGIRSIALTYTIRIEGFDDTPPTILYADDTTSKTAPIGEDSENILPSPTFYIDDVNSGDTAATLTVRATAVGAAMSAPDNPAYSTLTNADDVIAGTPKTIAGIYGGFTVSREADGSLRATYDLNQMNVTVQGLNVGDSLADKLVLYAHDGISESDALTWTITINGAEEPPPDNPVFGTLPSGYSIRDNVDAGGPGSSSAVSLGQVTATDPAGGSVTFSVAGAVAYDSVSGGNAVTTIPAAFGSNLASAFAVKTDGSLEYIGNPLSGINTVVKRIELTVTATAGSRSTVSGPIIVSVVNIDQGDAEFVITKANGSAVTTTNVGDVLAVDFDPASTNGRGGRDPDFSTETAPRLDTGDTYTYQWYYVDTTNEDIAEATNKTYTITRADREKTIGVRVTYDDDSFENDGTTPTGTVTITDELTAAVLPLFPVPGTLVQGTTGNDASLNGTSASELIRGGAGHDIITTGGGDDVVVGGYGQDTINLGAGAEIIVYRYDSDGGVNGFWHGVDGGGEINNFRRGVDKFVMVDIDDDGNPINDFAEFVSEDGNNREIKVNFFVNSIGISQYASGISFVFTTIGSPTGPTGGSKIFADRQFTINFDPAYRPLKSELSESTTITDYNLVDDLFGIGSLIVVAADELPNGFSFDIV